MLSYIKRWAQPGKGELVVPPLCEAARARQEVLRQLLRTPASPGEEEYEQLLARVFEMATSLCNPAQKIEDEDDTPRHRCASARSGWEAIGFQASAPDREFRGGGTLGLHCLVYVLEKHSKLCRSVIEGPFPFAAASINMTLVAARLSGVVEEGDDVALDPLESDQRRISESRAQYLLASSHQGFFELHVAALEALDRARRDVDAGPMDFAGCAAAARDEMAVLLAHKPRDIASLKALVAAVPRRTSGFLMAVMLPDDGKSTRRRRKCWFTLSTGVVRWYHEGDVHCHDRRTAAIALEPGKPAGSLKLEASMTVKFNQQTHSFSVYRGDGSTALHAIAPDADAMGRWCVALSEHVALASVVPGLAKASTVKATLHSDTFPTGMPFQVVETIGIYVRSAPDVAATRTGRGLMPGDRVTVLERRRIYDPSAGPRGRSFLRLQDDLNADSWVMEHHPSTYEPILLPVDRDEPRDDSSQTKRG